MKIRISVLLIILIFKIYYCLKRRERRNYCNRFNRPKTCPPYGIPVCAWDSACISQPCFFNAPNQCEACKNNRVDYTTPGRCGL